MTLDEEQIIDQAIEIIGNHPSKWEDAQVKPDLLDRLQEFIIYNQP